MVFQGLQASIFSNFSPTSNGKNDPNNPNNQDQEKAILSKKAFNIKHQLRLSPKNQMLLNAQKIPSGSRV